MEILCFLAGLLFLYTKNILLCFFLIALSFFRRGLRCFFVFFIAIFWGILHQWLVAVKNIPNKSIITKACIIGRIISIPVQHSNKTQFQFKVTSFNGKRAKAIVIMSCYKNCPNFSTNKSYKIIADLKKPRNLGNPGGFDYVNWLYSKHIHWVGTVKNVFILENKKFTKYSLLNFRNYLATNLEKLAIDKNTLGILQALSLGVTTNLDKVDWELFRRTGTTHLLIISGAHIGLIAGLFFFVGRLFWCRLGSLAIRFPAPMVASILAIFSALSYSIIAGFSVSVKRSFLACFFVLSRNFLPYKFSPWQAWRYAILLILVVEPHAVLLPGFYLSFIAVAILLTMNKYILITGIRKVILIQVACLLGIMPYTLFWFSYGAVNGFLANLVAIPLVGFIIVPLSLIVMILSQWFEISFLLFLLQLSVKCLWYFLTLIDSFAYFNLAITYKNFISPLALIIAMNLLIFLPLKALRIPVALLFFLSVFPKYEKLKSGEAQIDILDVGQGLSVLVRTANHQLIYDTGVKFSESWDMGKLVIIPYLKILGIKKIDKIVISHPDLDHRGGLDSLENTYKVKELIVDDSSFYKRGASCHDYKDWVWDGIHFHFFPIEKFTKNKNNLSCVLQIKSKYATILLTGDIEKLAEDYLVKNYQTNLESKFLLAPHHGSKTSSSKSFLRQVKPEFVFLSYGFNNKYHFPHSKTLQNYASHHIKILNTLDCGMISVNLSNFKSNNLEPKCFYKVQS